MRTAIFSVYQKNLFVPDDVVFLLKSLRSVSDKIIVVVNGNINNSNVLEENSDIVFYRENKGFDAGAYKFVLNKDAHLNFIQNSDELVFCNDTFYGPFIPFKQIFEEMDSAECDFWGLNLADNGFVTFLQSFFLCFRKKVIESNALDDFFSKNINENTLDFYEVLLKFERGIFDYLVENNFKYGYYRKQVHHVMSNPAGSIVYDTLPLLKKKSFSEKFYNNDSILDALSFINKNYTYNIDYILNDVKDRYGIVINKNDFCNRDLSKVSSKTMDYSMVSKNQIKDFVKNHKSVYLYGAGRLARTISELIGIENIQGFIVSSPDENQGFYLGKNVYCITDFLQNRSVPIIVALNSANTVEVKSILKDFANILFLW